MISVSDDFIEAALAPNQIALGTLLMLDAEGNIFSLLRDNIQEFTVTRSASDSSSYTVGSAEPSMLEAKVLSSFISGSYTPESFEGMSVIPMVGYQWNGANRWVMLGRFWIDDTKTVVSDIFTSFTAYDSINSQVMSRFAKITKQTGSGYVRYSFVDSEDSSKSGLCYYTGNSTGPLQNVNTLVSLVNQLEGDNRFFVGSTDNMLDGAQGHYGLTALNESSEEGQTYRGILQRIAVSCGANAITKPYGQEIVDPTLSPVPSSSGYPCTKVGNKLTISTLQGSYNASTETLSIEPAYYQMREETAFLYSQLGVVLSNQAGGLGFVKPNGIPLYIGSTYTATYTAASYKLAIPGISGTYDQQTQRLSIAFEEVYVDGSRVYALKSSNVVGGSSIKMGGLSFDSTGYTRFDKAIAEVDSTTYTRIYEPWNAGFSFDGTYFLSQADFSTVADRCLDEGLNAYRGFSLDAYGLVFIDPLDLVFVKDVRGNTRLLMPIQTKVTFNGGLSCQLTAESSNDIVSITTG